MREGIIDDAGVRLQRMGAVIARDIIEVAGAIGGIEDLDGFMQRLVRDTGELPALRLQFIETGLQPRIRLRLVGAVLLEEIHVQVPGVIEKLHHLIRLLVEIDRPVLVLLLPLLRFSIVTVRRGRQGALDELLTAVSDELLRLLERDAVEAQLIHGFIHGVLETVERVHERSIEIH